MCGKLRTSYLKTKIPDVKGNKTRGFLLLRYPNVFKNDAILSYYQRIQPKALCYTLKESFLYEIEWFFL